MKTSLSKSTMGKANLLKDAVKFVKNDVCGAKKMEAAATQIATYSTIFGISIGIVVGIVGTVLMQKYAVPPQVPPQGPPQA